MGMVSYMTCSELNISELPHLRNLPAIIDNFKRKARILCPRSVLLRSVFEAIGAHIILITTVI